MGASEKLPPAQADALSKPSDYETAKAIASGPDVAARVKLAANVGTPPELLFYLANDPLVHVRVAVTLNPATLPQVHHHLAADPDEHVRALLARKLATLAPTLNGQEQQRLKNHAFETLSLLVADEATRVRAAITDILKEMHGIPREMILRLAGDTEVAVSEPVLRLSPLLTQADLLALLAAPPHAQTAKTIAGRPDVGEGVADAIATGADSVAVRTLLANRSAAIREATLDALINRSRQQPEWHEPLVGRPKLSDKGARNLSGIVATHLLKVLAERVDLGPDTTEELQRRLTKRLAQPPGTVAQPDETADEDGLEAARQLEASGRLDERALLEALQQGNANYAAHLLAVAAGVPVEVVRRASSLRSAKGIVSLIWAAGFTMRIAGPLQSLLGQISPGSTLAPRNGMGFPLTSEEMQWQIEFLKNAQ
jgi:uncharacterized protein (DUF2336 family)